MPGASEDRSLSPHPGLVSFLPLLQARAQLGVGGAQLSVSTAQTDHFLSVRRRLTCTGTGSQIMRHTFLGHVLTS